MIAKANPSVPGDAATGSVAEVACCNCPECFRQVSLDEASVADGHECPSCKTQLLQVIPFIYWGNGPGWFWRRR